jgi:exo-beta-1,3-glucanase (GH17 family)
MSFRPEQFLRNQQQPFKNGIGFIEDKSENEIVDIFLEILHNGFHGICFSPYENGQKPGDQLTEAQIRRRIEKLSKHTQWIRSFSCTEGNELIPKIAKEYGLKTLVGAWLGSDVEKNQVEIENLIQLAKDGFVDIAAVGNEVLYRKDLTESELLAYVSTVKKAVNPIPVGYVDAYYEFVERPEITRMCDIILCNCYPYWEGTAIENSLMHMKSMYQKVKDVAGNKKVIITETGWPSSGQALGESNPSEMNALKYFINTHLWASDDNIETFYFSSFDESWKVGSEGDVGAHWGIWDSSEQLKFVKEYI